MPAPISIVIPTLNPGESFAPALLSLYPGLESGLVRELVVSDGGSDDFTAEIAEDAGAIWVSSPPGRGAQLRRGVDAASGEWLLFLHADTRLPPDWPDLAETLMRRTDRAGYFRLRFDVLGLRPHVVAAWANLRSWAFGLPYGDQGLLIHRSLLDRVGGVPDLPLMEDVALARALRGRLTCLPGTVVTSAIRYEEEGWFRRGAANFALLLRFLLGADPERLASRYRASRN